MAPSNRLGAAAGRSILKLRYLLLVPVALVCLMEQPVHAAEIEGVTFSESVHSGESPLRLHGTGLLRYRLFIKGYVAALYLAESFVGEATPEAVLGDVPRRLEIEYFWGISSEDFTRATVAGIERSAGREALAQLGPRIDRLNSLYRNVQPGDRYALTYEPGVGTELALNGQRLGTVEGADFAAALFAIWLGEEPLDESLRRQLLAGR
jgi:hypothetical protein